MTSPPQLSFGGGGHKSRFICGYLNCDQRFSPLVASLPTMLVVRSRDDYTAIEAVDRNGIRPTTVPQGSSTWLATTLKFTINEASAGRPGNAAMLGRLTELMFVEILRECMQRLPSDHGGWLSGLNDPYVGKALRLLHATPLGTGPSTSSHTRWRLTVRAGTTVHRPGWEAPMRYLTNWRIQLAKQMLREGTHTFKKWRRALGTSPKPRSTAHSNARPVLRLPRGARAR